MEYYNINTVDLFLYALSNAFLVDVLAIKSNTEECWFEDLVTTLKIEKCCTL